MFTQTTGNLPATLSSERHADRSRRIRAAQYVRMSTDHQKCSIEMQEAAILCYADDHGFDIIRGYADAGKSGLTARGRNGLKQMIADVQAGSADFSAILVYDVSRWGRFQDTDESAYYEYICKRENIRVHYCTEMFANDGSVTATLLKWIKRAMAAEYSRELSVKVFAAQSRLTEMGFHQGGHPGYGLRRWAVDEERRPRGELAPGERKFLQTHRVVLRPGPSDEVATVRRIFSLYTIDGIR